MPNKLKTREEAEWSRKKVSTEENLRSKG